MEPVRPGRRAFLRHSALITGAALTGLPAQAVAQFVRPEWSDFKNSSHYAPLLSAIATMKANTNAADPNSWTYWVNVHMSYCPHGVAYFLAWHRGYLYYFEQRLRTVSRDAMLVLPYWNYFANPNLPAEFTNPASTNPLYVARANTNVRQALDLTAFGPSVVQFPRGASPAFEPICEDAPHNPVHNIIGGVMADMNSPIDPIFWLHHANVDRLWAAWIQAGGGRAMAAKTDPYWSGNHTYASGLTIPRSWTYSNRSSLNYYYANESMPTSLPALTTDAEAQRGAAFGAAIAPAFATTGARSIDPTTFAAVGATQVGLDERSMHVALPVPTAHQVAVTRIARGLPSATTGRSEQFKSLRLTFTNVETTREGRAGGYYYNVWLTVPGAGATRVKAGTLGAFQIASSMHHTPGTVSWPITPYLRDFSPTDLATLTVYLERVNGDNSPRGAAIGIGEVRFDMSTLD